MELPAWQAAFGDGPLVACAIHDGTIVRPEVAKLLALDEMQRLYEEDPYTGVWTTLAATRVVGMRSRFEIDLNRPRERAVYLTPADAWGLSVWKSLPPTDLVERSLATYDDFYALLELTLKRLVARHQRVVVFDMHSYNHRRQGCEAPPDDPELNPDINLGTQTMDRDYWKPVVERFLGEMRHFDFLGQPLDVRADVKSFGRHMAEWIHEKFPKQVCVLSIDVKKFFMDEWTGIVDLSQLNAIGAALQSAADGILDELEN